MTHATQVKDSPRRAIARRPDTGLDAEILRFLIEDRSMTTREATSGLLERAIRHRAGDPADRDAAARFLEVALAAWTAAQIEEEIEQALLPSRMRRLLRFTR